MDTIKKSCKTCGHSCHCYSPDCESCSCDVCDCGRIIDSIELKSDEQAEAEQEEQN